MQVAENTQRLDVNAIGMARNVANLIMATRRDEVDFMPYHVCVTDDGCDRAYYAQALEHNAKRGTGEAIRNALNVSSEGYITNYRKLLGLTDEAWMLADEQDTPEGRLRLILKLPKDIQVQAVRADWDTTKIQSAIEASKPKQHGDNFTNVRLSQQSSTPPPPPPQRDSTPAGPPAPPAQLPQQPAVSDEWDDEWTPPDDHIPNSQPTDSPTPADERQYAPAHDTRPAPKPAGAENRPIADNLTVAQYETLEALKHLAEAQNNGAASSSIGWLLKVRAETIRGHVAKHGADDMAYYLNHTTGNVMSFIDEFKQRVYELILDVAEVAGIEDNSE